MLRQKVGENYLGDKTGRTGWSDWGGVGVARSRVGLGRPSGFDLRAGGFLKGDEGYGEGGGPGLGLLLVISSTDLLEEHEAAANQHLWHQLWDMCG